MNTKETIRCNKCGNTNNVDIMWKKYTCMNCNAEYHKEKCCSKCHSRDLSKKNALGKYVCNSCGHKAYLPYEEWFMTKRGKKEYLNWFDHKMATDPYLIDNKNQDSGKTIEQNEFEGFYAYDIKTNDQNVESPVKLNNHSLCNDKQQTEKDNIDESEIKSDMKTDNLICKKCGSNKISFVGDKYKCMICGSKHSVGYICSICGTTNEIVNDNSFKCKICGQRNDLNNKILILEPEQNLKKVDLNDLAYEAKCLLKNKSIYNETLTFVEQATNRDRDYIFGGFTRCFKEFVSLFFIPVSKSKYPRSTIHELDDDVLNTLKRSGFYSVSKTIIKPGIVGEDYYPFSEFYDNVKNVIKKSDLEISIICVNMILEVAIEKYSKESIFYTYSINDEIFEDATIKCLVEYIMIKESVDTSFRLSYNKCFRTIVCYIIKKQIFGYNNIEQLLSDCEKEANEIVKEMKHNKFIGNQTELSEFGKKIDAIILKKQQDAIEKQRIEQENALKEQRIEQENVIRKQKIEQENAIRKQKNRTREGKAKKN